jgi:hypothetical protein
MEKCQQSYQHFNEVVMPEVGHAKLYDLFLRLENFEVRVALCNLLKQEKLEQEKGRYTTVHSQKNSWWVRAMIFRRILSIVCGQELPTIYYPLRFTALGKFLPASRAAEIVAYGSAQNETILFMNPALTSSCFRGGSMGSSSLNFFVNNHDWSNVQIIIKDLFKTYELEKYYDDYVQEFEALEREALENDNFGTMLLLSFSPEQIEKSVYSGKSGGGKHGITIDGKRTTNAKEIIDAMRHKPKSIDQYDFDCIELCFALCDDPKTGAMHPFSQDPVHVYWYRAKDMAPWLKKLDALFAKIKCDIEYDKAVEQQDKVQQVSLEKHNTMGTLKDGLPKLSEKELYCLAILANQMQ